MKGRRQQRLPAGERHRRRGRRLVARRGEDEPRAPQPPVHHQPALVHRHRVHAPRAQGQHVAEIRVARVLDHHPRIAVHQQRGDEVERVLRPHRHDDLLGPRHDPPPRQHAARDLLQEQRVVLVVAVERPGIEPPLAHRLAHAVAPLADGEDRVVHLAVDEGIGEGLPVVRALNEALRLHVLGEPSVPVHPALRVAGRLLGRAVQTVGRLRVDVEAAPLARGEETLGHQRLVGQRHRVARNAEPLRHGAGRGHGLARHQLTGRDRPH